jgi:5-methylcytosine-specific restriction endonuclease McrA
MPTCPTCGDEFGTRRGLGVHHSSVHDERLPNRECSRCGSEFYCEYDKKYCSDTCREASVSFEGDNNPNYRGGKETTACEICGEAFEYWPSEKPGLYCAECVAHEQWRHDRDITGDQNPRWNGGMRTVQCDRCGSSVERRPSRLRSEHVFCSAECQHEWLSESFAGEGHPNWKGGSTPNYGRGWRRAKERALERDGRECVLCGTTAEELGRNPDVHHIVPVRAFLETPVTTERDAHYPANLASLCPSCHRRAEFGGVGAARLRAATPSAAAF